MRILVLILLFGGCLACNGEQSSEAGQPEKLISVEPQVVDLAERHYLVFRQELPLDNMNGFFGIECPILVDKAKAAGIKATGPISGLFYRWDTDLGVGDAAVALPVPAGTELEGYVLLTLPPQRAFATEWVGDYGGLGAIHYALNAQFQLKELTPAAPSIEEYYRGPVDGVAESEFRTRIIYPIAE